MRVRERTIRRGLLGLLLLGAGCGATAVAPAPILPVDPPPIVEPSRFTGTWLVEETVAHATYFAALYEFAEDGSLTLLENFSYDLGVSYPQVGWAGNLYLVCEFGERWRSEDDRLLEIDGACSDEVTRPIQIAFETEPDRNTERAGASVRLVSVGGDTQMWSEPPWGWHFIKCQPDRSNCQPW